MPSATITTEVPVPENPQTGSLKIAVLLNPTKVDMPSLGVSTSLGQVSATSSTKTSTSDLQPTVTSGNTDTGQDLSPAQDFSDVDSLPGRSDKDSEDGEISNFETQEQNEEINCRETVRVVRAFLGWSHILDFECSVGDVDGSDNPWKGKYPCKISRAHDG